MKTISKQQFTKEIKRHFTTNTGLSIVEAKRQIKNQIKIDEFDTSIKTSNVRMFYTSNTNYSGGKRNGYGKGFYLTSVGFTGGSEIKL